MVEVRIEGQPVAQRDLFGAVRYEEVNGEHYIDLETTRKFDQGDIVLVKSALDGRWREYVVWSVQEPHERDLIVRKYRCVWSLQAFLSSSTSSAMPGTKGTPATARQAITQLLKEQTAWRVGTVEPTTTGGASFWRMSAWEGLSELLRTWGGEVDANVDPENGTRQVDLLESLGRPGSFTFYYGGSEIESITVKQPDNPYCCRIYPLGAAEPTDSWGYGRKVDISSVNGGVPWLQDDLKAAEMAGYPNPTATVYVENPDAKTPQELKVWALSVLHDHTRPEPEYEVKTVERQYVQGEYIPSLGDGGTIIDTALGLTLQSRVMAIKVDELSKSIATTISNKRLAPGSFAALLKKETKAQYEMTWGVAATHTWGEMLAWGR